MSNQCSSCGGFCKKSGCERIDEPQKNVSEPVAWYYAGNDVEPKSVALSKDLDDEQKLNCVPLYAALPQQEPLTATFKYQTYEFDTEKGGFYSEEKTHEL